MTDAVDEHVVNLAAVGRPSYPQVKRARTRWPIHDLLARRFSPYCFAADVPDASVLRSLFTAAVWAPSSYNSQPWRFLVGIRPDETWTKIFAALTEQNQLWTRTAPVLGLAVVKTVHRDQAVPTAPYDLGQAVAHLSIEATARGLYVHQMAGFCAEHVSDAFAIPSDFSALTTFAIGHLGDPMTLEGEDLEDELSERSRRELSSTVFESRFGDAASWVLPGAD